MILTKHAKKRAQQRGIPPAILRWLHEFGATKHSHLGLKRFFDGAARKRLAKALGREVVDRLGDLLNCFLVETTEGVVITTGHRTARIRRR
jgi:hypothetical protein